MSGPQGRAAPTVRPVVLVAGCNDHRVADNPVPMQLLSAFGAACAAYRTQRTSQR